jgi:SP family sugar:H+ symporter-like MFS transporter
VLSYLSPFLSYPADDPFRTFFGALIAGDVADMIGRRGTVIGGCGIFIIGVILQVASSTIPLLVVGRLVAGFGVGFVTAIIILYMGEIAPKKIRGSIISGYQFCITIGIVLAACVTYATEVCHGISLLQFLLTFA